MKRLNTVNLKKPSKSILAESENENPDRAPYEMPSCNAMPLRLITLGGTSGNADQDSQFPAFVD